MVYYGVPFVVVKIVMLKGPWLALTTFPSLSLPHCPVMVLLRCKDHTERSLHHQTSLRARFVGTFSGQLQ